MEKLLGKYSGEIFAVTRIIIGVIFMLNGLVKFGIFGGQMAGGIFLAAGIIETVAGALIALGFYSRWAAFIASGQMAVAYFMVHFAMGPLPVSDPPGMDIALFNNGERATFYAWFFLYLAARGPGKWSLNSE